MGDADRDQHDADPAEPDDATDADPDVYPMPLFVQLQVVDVERSAEWYAEVGFAVVYEVWGMAHLQYRTYADVMLVEDGSVATEGSRPVDAPSPNNPRGSNGIRGSGVAIYLTVEGESVDDVAARTRWLDAGSVTGPTETAWITLEVHVADPAGYALVFSEAVDEGRPFDEVMGEPAGGV